MSYRSSDRRRIRMTIRKQNNEPREAAAALLLTAFLCITVFSRSSFLYEQNPWSDANIFLTIGRGMLKGKQMYTDLFDHKGPLLYVLYAAAAMISDHSFIGVYLIELICLFWFLRECWKTLKLLHTEHPFPGLFLIAMVIVTAKAFSFGGGSVEELSLPLLMHCLYLSLKRILAEESFSKKDCFMIGILASAVFLMKFTLCGFFAGLAAALILYQAEQDRSRLLPCIMEALAGFLVPVLITVLLFALHGNLSDFLEVYFGYNLNQYPASAGILTRIYRMARAYFFYLKNNPVLILFSTIGLFAGIHEFHQKPEARNLLILTFLCWYFISFIGNIFIAYYILPMICFSVFLLPSASRKMNLKVMISLSAGLSVLCAYGSSNLRAIGRHGSVQQDFVTLIQSNDPSASYLMLEGYDQGFYLQGGEIPACRYFSAINSETEEMKQERLRCIEEKQIRYLISMDHELDLPGYDLIAQETGEYDGIDRVYRLYERKSSK